MAITNERFEALLRKLGCAFEFDAKRNCFVLAFPTQTYRSPSGHDHVTIVALLTEDGEFVRFIAPSVYDLSRSAHRAITCEAAMQVAWTTKALAFELEADTGHLWAVIEFPLADNVLTERQLKRCLLLAVDLLDDYHAVLSHAAMTGKIDFSLAGRSTPAQPEPTEAELLIAQLGGVDQLRKIVAGSSSALDWFGWKSRD
jgi:hypothetical protein